MIAGGSSTLIAHFNDLAGDDVARLRRAFTADDLVLPPVVASEVLSDPGVDRFIETRLAELVLLPVLDGFWHRAGDARRKLLAGGFKARVGDALIAQSCIDHECRSSHATVTSATSPNTAG